MARRARKIAIDIRFIEEIEEALAMDCEPPPGVIAPLAARAEAERAAWRNPYDDDELQEDIQKALDPYGSFLELEEIHAVQQLRGWHRFRHGSVTVNARRLAAVQDVLATLGHALNDECQATLEEFGLDSIGPADLARLGRREYPSFREVRAAVLASMARDETCGECKWCWIRRLHVECTALLENVPTGGLL